MKMIDYTSAEKTMKVTRNSAQNQRLTIVIPGCENQQKWPLEVAPSVSRQPIYVWFIVQLE